MFKLKQAQTQRMIDTEQARLTRIAARLRQIEQEGKLPKYDVLLKQVDALLVASCREIVPFVSGFRQSYDKIAAYLDQQHAQPGSPVIVLLHSRSEQREDGLHIDAETTIPLSSTLPGNEQLTIQTLPGELMACTIHTGADLFLGQAHSALYRWIKENKYELTGQPRLVFLLRDEPASPMQHVTEVQFPIARRR